MDLANNLKRIRKENKITQQELAEKLCCSRSTIANYEQGNRIPNIYILNDIAQIFNCSLDSLLGTDVDNKPYYLKTKKNGPINLIIDSKSGQIIDANEKAIIFYGYSKEDFLEKKIWQIDSYEKKKLKEIIFQITQGLQRKFFSEHRTRDGTVKNVEVNCFPFKNKNNIYLNSVIYDITESDSIIDYNKLTCSIINKLITCKKYCRIQYIKEHLEKVTKFSLYIGKKLNLSPDQLENVRIAANLHDIGMLNIPDVILNKPSKLNKQEKEIVKLHPREGYKILRIIGLVEPIPKIVLQHHENFNGTGYPQGLNGDSILIESRILNVADTIAAMTSPRPYRDQHKKRKVLEEIENGKGKLFDPDIVNITKSLFSKKQIH